MAPHSRPEGRALSFSRVFYESYHVESGEAIGPVGDYDDAISEALKEEAYRYWEIGDRAFDSPEELEAAMAAAQCAVRFVRAERPE